MFLNEFLELWGAQKSQLDGYDSLERTPGSNLSQNGVLEVDKGLKIESKNMNLELLISLLFQPNTLW